jgi:hypothetical protein
MLKTYSLYLHHAEQGRLFEPFLGESDGDAFTRAQELLGSDDAIHLVDVHFGDQHLFSVSSSGS